MAKNFLFSEKCCVFFPHLAEKLNARADAKHTINFKRPYSDISTDSDNSNSSDNFNNLDSIGIIGKIGEIRINRKIRGIGIIGEIEKIRITGEIGKI